MVSFLNDNDRKVLVMQNECDALADEVHCDMLEGMSANPKLTDSWTEFEAQVQEMNALINGGVDPMLYFIEWVSQELAALRKGKVAV